MNFLKGEGARETNLNEFMENLSKSLFPQVPGITTPSDSYKLVMQVRLDRELSQLNLTKELNYDRFNITKDGDIFVQTEKEKWEPITYKNNPSRFLEKPKLSSRDYRTLFGIDKEEYNKRVRNTNDNRDNDLNKYAQQEQQFDKYTDDIIDEAHALRDEMEMTSLNKVG